MAEKKVTIVITGLHDDHAAETVLSALSAVPGARFAELSAGDGTANIEYDDTEASPEDFVSVVEAGGFGAELA